MARINLLPWREELRQERQRQFYIALGASALGAALILLAVVMFYNGRIDTQEERNRYLETEIRKLDRQIERIAELEETRDRLLARKEVIERLQKDRTLMVHLFDQLVRTVPTGIRLTSVQQQGNKLTINGMTQSNARVSTYLRNLEASPWFHDHDLRIVEVEGEDNEGATDPDSRYRFSVQVTLRGPNDEAEGFDQPAGEGRT